MYETKRFCYKPKQCYFVEPWKLKQKGDVDSVHQN